MVLSDWINPKYLDPVNILQLRIELHQKKYVHLLALENFFTDEIIQKIDQEFLINSEKKYLKTDIYADGTVNIDFYSYKSPFIDEFKNFFHGDTFLKYLSLYFGHKLSFVHERKILNEVTNNGILVQSFGNKNFLNWHDDRDDDGMLLFYLNKDWDISKGGELELGYTDDNGDYISYESVQPKFNTLAILIPKLGTYHRVASVKDSYVRRLLVEHLSFKK